MRYKKTFIITIILLIFSVLLYGCSLQIQNDSITESSYCIKNAITLNANNQLILVKNNQQISKCEFNPNINSVGCETDILTSLQK